ncbi:CENP-S associating centromere protein X-domain-containing protein [Phyllosticta citriasiana]|uniref:CENP-S associating centromere protein X-domain-containing protein n=2 Tax=Phyllosticta citriasiana TaxID=595635 RepID=A0ABR1KN12_9PEZI
MVDASRHVIAWSLAAGRRRAHRSPPQSRCALFIHDQTTLIHLYSYISRPIASMPPMRQQSANKAFKPPRQLKNQPTAVEAGPSQTATSRNQARVALGRAGPSSTTVRPGAAFKPATTVISSSPIVMSDIEDDFSADDLNGTPLATAPRRRRISSAHRGSPSRHQETALPPSQDALGATAKDPIPAKLLNALLHEGFEDKEMRIGKEAMAVTQKYVETFVREALARAMIGRQTEEESVGGAGDGFLQVEDLEKLAPQLLLDF